jgi:hypothetical protein
MSNPTNSTTEAVAIEICVWTGPNTDRWVSFNDRENARQFIADEVGDLNHDIFVDGEEVESL